MNQSEFMSQVCIGLEWPVTSLSLNLLNAWAFMEYGDKDGNGMTELFDQAWNPLATTWPDSPTTRRSTKDIGYGPGKWNLANGGQGVGIYASAQDGINATVATLAQPNYYISIRKAFKEQSWNPGLEADFQTYIGSPGYAKNLADMFKAAEETRFVLTAEVLNDALQNRMAMTRAANDPDITRVQGMIAAIKAAGYTI